MEIRIYFEGNRALRTGFKRFFSELEQLVAGRDFRIEFVAAKDGPSDYRKARRSHPHAWNILLKDSEQEMPKRPASLCRRYGIDATLAEDVFWMVQLMEAWFLADPDALNAYYGKKGFSAKALGKAGDVESIPKSEVLERLRRATEGTTKGGYEKAHAPFVLERLNASLVQQRAQHCRRLFEAVRARLEP